jgi:P27 family predicted phage terminase small subunit
MKPGPAPKPSALRKLGGQRIRNFNEPQPERLAAMPSAPAHLNRYAKRFWRETGGQLLAVDMLTRADLASFELLAMHYGTVIALAKQIESDGYSTVDERGLPRKNPLFSTLHTASQLYRSYSSVFGLDPANRSRLTIEPPKDDEAKLFDELFG